MLELSDYFDSLTKLFSDLYLAKFLDIPAKPFRIIRKKSNIIMRLFEIKSFSLCKRMLSLVRRNILKIACNFK